MRFQLISSSGVKFDGDAFEVIAPTVGGSIAIFKDHMPLISAGAPGVLSIRKKAGDADRDMEHFAVYGGLVQTDGDSTRFVTDDVISPEEVSEAEARKALDRAQELVAGAETREALHEARRVQVHHEVRLHLAQLKARHHR